MAVNGKFLRILRQLLAEGLLLALAGGAAGLFFSTWAIHLLRAIAPPETPRMDRIRLDAGVLWFTLGISLLVGVLVGLAPALQASSRRLAHATKNAFYTSFSFRSSGWAIIAKTSSDPMPSVPAIVRAVHAVDQEARITNIETVDQILAESSAEPRFQTALMGSFGVLGLLLAVTGVYGVISCSVAQRTHEIGVRMAIGAERKDVLRMVLREGMLLAVCGTAAGIGGALALTRFCAACCSKLSRQIRRPFSA